MTKINLDPKTIKALHTFRDTAAKGRRAALFFSAGIHTQFASLDRAERGALKVAIVANSVKFDREAAKAAKVSYADWCKAKCHSRHSVMANVETDMKQNTRFESNPEYLDAGYDNDSEGFASFLNEEHIGNFAEWNRWYFKNTAAGKVTAKKEAAKRKAKKAADAEPKEVSFTVAGKSDEGPKLDAADTVLEVLITQAAEHGLDIGELYDTLGDRVADMLVIAEKKAAVNS